MMWNWLVSALAVGATVVLYDGSPFIPTPNVLWDSVDSLGYVTFFLPSIMFNFQIWLEISEAEHVPDLISRHDLTNGGLDPHPNQVPSPLPSPTMKLV